MDHVQEWKALTRGQGMVSTQKQCCRKEENDMDLIQFLLKFLYSGHLRKMRSRVKLSASGLKDFVDLLCKNS